LSRWALVERDAVPPALVVTDPRVMFKSLAWRSITNFVLADPATVASTWRVLPAISMVAVPDWNG